MFGAYAIASDAVIEDNIRIVPGGGDLTVIDHPTGLGVIWWDIQICFFLVLGVVLVAWVIDQIPVIGAHRRAAPAAQVALGGGAITVVCGLAAFGLSGTFVGSAALIGIVPAEQVNRRNGSTPKTIATQHGSVTVEVPRDRRGSFEPQIVAKHQRRFEAFDDKIIALYAGGMTTREIERHLAQVYGVQVGRDLVSRVTDAVLEDVTEWQSRPLEPLYPIIWLDALVVKIRAQGRVQNHHCYLAVGVNDAGIREVLGLWITRGEGAKQWMAILSELETAASKMSLSAALTASKAFPTRSKQSGQKRSSRPASCTWSETACASSPKTPTSSARDLRKVYSATTEEAASHELDRFAEAWDERFPMITRSWQENW